MHTKQADLYGWDETNVPWTELCKKQTEYHGLRIHDNYKLIVTLSNEFAEYKQPGGANDKGLGHWCYTCIAGRDQHKVYFVVGYQPCKENKPGDTTVNAQQKRLLTMQGEHDSKPGKCGIMICFV
eukprot:13286217-Ditylum_brightwellii.AAC.2